MIKQIKKFLMSLVVCQLAIIIIPLPILGIGILLHYLTGMRADIIGVFILTGGMIIGVMLSGVLIRLTKFWELSGKY